MRGALLLTVAATVVACEKPARKLAPPVPTPLDAPGAAMPAAQKDAAPAARKNAAPTPLKDAPKAAVKPPACGKRTSKKGDCCVGYAPKPGRDASPMCRVVGGRFIMGHGEPKTEGHPWHPVTLSSFYIDQYEVTVAQYVKFLKAIGSHTSCPTEGDDRCVAMQSEFPGARAGAGKRLPIDKKNGQYVIARGTANEPVRAVSHAGAQRYCRWAGKQLPTEAQWEYAARHDPKTGRDLVYPWGDTFAANRANCGSAWCKDGFKALAPVGTFNGTGKYGDGSSPWGVHDMVGNVAEWVSDCYRVGYKFCMNGCTDPTGPPKCITGIAGRPLQPSDVSTGPSARETIHGVRGGSFVAGRYETYERNSSTRDYLMSDTGFRCVRR